MPKYQMYFDTITGESKYNVDVVLTFSRDGIEIHLILRHDGSSAAARGNSGLTACGQGVRPQRVGQVFNRPLATAALAVARVPTGAALRSATPAAHSQVRFFRRHLAQLAAAVLGPRTELTIPPARIRGEDGHSVLFA